MIHSIESLTAIAEETRQDFLERNIAVPRLVEAVTLYLPHTASQLSSGELIRQAAESIENFPNEACQFASAELRRRIGYGNIVEGHFYETGDGTDISNVRWWHAFVNLGRLAGAETLIADITADQFGGPAVHVGELREPWSITQVRDDY